MAYLNKVMLIGNVGNSVETKQLANGKFAKFSLATSRRYKDKNGEQKEETNWHTVVTYGSLVDILQKLGVGKGTKMYVEGTLTNRSWDDQATGQKRYATEIRMETFQLLGQRQQCQQNGGSQHGGYNPYSAANQSPAQRQQGFGGNQPQDNWYQEEEEDLPF